MSPRADFAVRAGLFFCSLPNPLNWSFPFMPDLFSRWITRWEHQLATRDTNRIVRPFDWGAEWLPMASRNGDTRGHVSDFVTRTVAESDRFFAYEAPRDHRFDGRHLTFTKIGRAHV